MFKIEMLPAYEGDSLWVEYGDGTETRRLAIDAGRKNTYRELQQRIEAAGAPLELFVMTHIDDDHIFGAIPLLSDGRISAASIKDVWYNGFTHLDPAVAMRPAQDLLGPKNGEIFSGLLLQGGFAWNEAWDQGATIVVPKHGSLPRRTLDGGLTLTLLSPAWTQLEALRAFWIRELEDMEPGDAAAALELFAERSSLQPDVPSDLLGALDVEDLVDQTFESDTKEPNGSSIALLAEFDGKSILLTGDAHPPVLESSIRRLLAERGESLLRLDACKVSHHGSAHNTSPGLLELLDCRRFLISTNGSRHHHPDREAVARIIHRYHDRLDPTELYFNYRSDENEVWDDDDLRTEWNYRTLYPPAGQTLDLAQP
jgi:beta-lactamase superfamily II metal-dependent hydrolase